MRRIAKQFAKNGGASLSPAQGRPASQGLRENTRFPAQCFLIWEIPTRSVRCLVPADVDGNMPAERVAAMLAMHCLALNRRLEDFEVLILPQSSLPAKVTERAKQLIEAGLSIGAAVKVSSTERTVLDRVVRKLTNKEIASELGVSVRTVKFHVSSLLAKFDVPNRTALARHAVAGQISRFGLADLGVRTAPFSQANTEQGDECLAVSPLDGFR